MNAKERERQEAIEELRKHIVPGQTIYTKLNHVSRSGMYRVLDVFVIKDNEPLCFSWSVAKAIDHRYDRRHEGVGMSGCGMDMGFAIVYDLSHALFRDGFTCIGKGCPSNDHRNGDRDYLPHHHVSGGYALKHRWL